jgi:hypothetical protein
MVQLRTNPDGSITEIVPERCPNGHELRYPNVIIRTGPGPEPACTCARLALLACKTTLYDD